MNDDLTPGTLEAYPAHGIITTEAALLDAWQGLENYHGNLVLVGGLAVHYHTKDKAHPIYRATSTLDVDFGIHIATDGGMRGSVDWDLAMLGYRAEPANGRMAKKLDHGNLYIDFLTEHPPHESGSRNVSDITASICPGINRALESRKIIEVEGTDRFGDACTFRIPICGIGPLLVLKLNAFAQRTSGKRAKDAYDILVAVSSYSEGAQAAITAFHDEATQSNSAYSGAVKTLETHFLSVDAHGPSKAQQFRYGHHAPGPEGEQLKADLVHIARTLLRL